MVEFLQNNALWPTIGTLVVGGYLFLRSIQLDRRYRDKRGSEAFSLSTFCWGISLVMWGSCYASLKTGGELEVSLFLSGIWLGATLLGLISFITGKILAREVLTEPFEITQRELNKKVEAEKKTMKIAVK